MISGLAAMAVGYLVLPIYVGMSRDATDILAAALLPLAICIWTYEDHRNQRPSAQLFGVLVPAFLVMFSVGAWVLLSGVRFGVLIPINAVIGGVLYWFIDKHIPAGSD
ncbi:MAG: hypothetical protein WA957_13210 [Alteraurantiacibacter sp.]